MLHSTLRTCSHHFLLAILVVAAFAFATLAIRILFIASVICRLVCN
jgi:hypothetical protein